MRVFAALHEDSQQGWVWLCDPTLPPRSVVKISERVSGKYIYCEALQIDANFLEHYNRSPRVSVRQPHDALVMSGWYRQKLGDLRAQTDVSLKIENRNDQAVAKFRACLDHPQIVVRVAAWLGGISVALGLIGMIFGIVGIYFSLK